ncbi:MULTISPECIES: ABC transporter substrate-binding protein [Marinomonas]|uniref:Amino acid/amide ABC transporter substrate-binding protein (HAAT family) n=1 Tax=Marinomonas alcarazii TaxID=491949 RepID=A0A318V013_9GAMM|nr:MULTISPECIES: ABC transporter substrate-binding protein [Marinomonas]PYF82246.1 amino acid/amide ABC transporter substrate-binding protein (HAAT family) [Marinomonas alcarazii]
MVLSRLVVFSFMFILANLSFASTSQAAQIIKVGMSGAFSGDNASMGEDFSAGARAAFSRFHSETGHTIQLMSMDDAYEPSQVGSNVRTLLKDSFVDVLFGNIGTPTIAVSAPIALENKTLLFAPVTGSSVIRPSTPDRYIINYRASYEEELTAIFDALANELKLTQNDIAFFNQQDMFGSTGRKYLNKLIKKHNIGSKNNLLQMEYSHNTLAVEHAVADLLTRTPTPKVIFMFSSAGPSAKFIRLTREYGLDPLFVGLSFMGNRLFVEQLQDIPARILITQVVPSFRDQTLPVAADFRQDMAKYSPQTKLNALSFEGYIAARVFTKPFTNELPTSREQIIDALESLGRFDIGLGVPLTLSPQEHQASHSVWLTQLKVGQLVSIPFSTAPKLYLDYIN